VPRAKPFPDSDEEEKTTIESQWEDEASTTTVEEGDAAGKIRSLIEPRRPANTSTGTGTGALDEPTVDDQQAHLSAITPVRDVARLVIAQGNDAGNEIEIRPGKPYTIGRAIDNDVVLTDISVSRKHFDLRFEDGAWVIVDRGSGNGTVVNGNLEDNPFMLANGDVIEIGNTVFRFDQPNAAPRPERTVDLDHDDEEPSTVAGRPLRPDPVEVPAPAMRVQRAKTLPPPTPLRGGRSGTQPPPAFPAATQPQPLAQPAPTIQPSPLAARPPMGTPGMPTMLGDPNLMQSQPMATIGPQGAQPRPMYQYPQATEIPPHSVHAQMLLIQTQNRRGDGSTVLVPPTPYDNVMMPPRYAAPQLSKRAKLVLSGIGLAVFAAVMTVAIVKSGDNKKSVAATAPVEKREMKAVGRTEPAADTPAPTTITETAKTVPTETAKTVPVETAKTVPTETAKTDKTPTVATTEPAKTESAKTETPKPTVAKTEAPKSTKTEAPKTTKTETPKTTKKKTEVRRETPVTTSTTSTAAKRSGGDADAAKSEAERLYRAKKFNEASTYLANAAKKYDESDARDMRRTSDLYAKLGRAMAQGTAPATRATDAFEALRSAQSYDRNVGNAFDSEIDTKLAQVAPKAALLYVANKNFPAARSAMLVAQQFGASESVKLVAQKLESAASELYNEGMKELSSNPSAAKDKFRQVLAIVDSKSTWYQKAQKQLKGG
jgi:outer membrane biosynthesis protein TonB